MIRLRSLAFLLPQLWRAFLTRPITVRYPFAPLDLPPHFRGRIAIQAEQCRGCGLCVRDCPAFALEIERSGQGAFKLIHYPDRCACCGQCETSCKAGAIRQVNSFVPAALDCRSLVEVLVERDTA